MSSIIEKQQFSTRLKEALKKEKHPISPTYLSTEFNYRYSGHPISVQSANNWLLGKAIPSQDKLSILSIWLNVSAHWLRFGEIAHVESPHETIQIIPNAQDVDIDHELFNKFNKLTKKQQKLILNLIDEFNRH